jgi:hypothetical protein
MPRRKLNDGEPTVSTDPSEIEALIGRLKQSDLPEREAVLAERLFRVSLIDKRGLAGLARPAERSDVVLVEFSATEPQRIERLCFSGKSLANSRIEE